MAAYVGAFMPGATSQITVGTSSATTPIGGNESVLLANTGANIAFFAFGNASTVVAATTGIPVFPNVNPRSYSIPPGATHIATIAGVATTLAMTPGVCI